MITSVYVGRPSPPWAALFAEVGTQLTANCNAMTFHPCAIEYIEYVLKIEYILCNHKAIIPSKNNALVPLRVLNETILIASVI